MNKLYIIAIALLSLQACKKEQKDYLSFSGKISNATAKKITVNNNEYNKEITLADDGSFADTLHLKTGGVYSLLMDNRNSGFAYLKNGFELHITADDSNFINTFKFTGNDAANSNFLISQYNYGRTLGNPTSLFALDSVTFKNKVAQFKKGFDSIKQLYTNLDADLLKSNTEENQQLFDYLKTNYASQHDRAVKAASAMALLAEGKPSPSFKNYENYKGGKTSLSNLKGKYVYIDLWATWCGPCKAEIPYLKNLEKKYHNKNIQFVSISIDNDRTSGTWKKANQKWREMVADKSLSGVQLFAGEDISFLQDYQVNSIPRFILLDPKGAIVSSNALRPSNPELVTLFTSLGI